jgi:hypothetical protein
VLAVAGLVLSTEWLREFEHGYTEPIAIGLLLGAVDQHLTDHPRRAFTLGALVALARPEALGLVALYGLVQWRRREVGPLSVVAGAAGVAALWVVPDWIGSGDPLHASHVARVVVPTGTAATLTALREAALILPWPVSLAAAAGIAVALRRGDPGVAWLGAVAGAWAALLAVMMFLGYPASSRFFALPAGLWCVAGAVGVMRVLEAAPSRRRRLVFGAALAAAGLVALPFRAGHAVREVGDSFDRATLEAQLHTVIRRAGVDLRRCGSPMLPGRLAWVKGEVAWDLGLPLRDVHQVRTSARAYVKRLQDPDGDPLPRLRPHGSIVVRPWRQESALLAPFGGDRLRVIGRAGWRPETVAADGRWRAVLLSGATCRMA